MNTDCAAITSKSDLLKALRDKDTKKVVICVMITDGYSANFNVSKEAVERMLAEMEALDEPMEEFHALFADNILYLGKI